MKIQLVSDMHMSAAREILYILEDADILVFAGDIFSRPTLAKIYFSNIRKVTDIPILYVLGNHEYYSNVFPRDAKLYSKAIEGISNCILLDNSVFTFQGVNFLGTTLWSDLSDPIAAYVVLRGLNDYQYIRDSHGKVLSTAVTHKVYRENVTWLSKELKQHEGETNVVISHHAPLWECRARDFDYQSDSQYLTAGFCSRMDTFISQHEIALWLYGHVHRNNPMRHGKTKVISNCMGFPYETEVCKYTPDLLIEI